MGIFDFLATDKQMGRRKKKYDPDDTSDLGLGGLKSLLGTRGAASKDARGDAMMSQTANDKLPGYFNPETREYVPWYVDLFDGGGLNQSEGLLGKDAQEIPTAVGLLETNGAPVQRAAQMAPGIGTQLSDMERLNRMPGVDPRNLGGSGPNIQENPLDPSGNDLIAQLKALGLPDLRVSTGFDTGPTRTGQGDSYVSDRMEQGGMTEEQAIDVFNRSSLSPPNTLDYYDSKNQYFNDLSAAKALKGGIYDNTILGVKATEFERFKSKFEKELKANGLWGFPDRIQETFDSLKSRGLNY